MPDIYLPSGGVITVDDEDYDFVIQWTWRVWSQNGKRPAIAIRDERRYGRTFRASLHREIGARVDPRLIKVGRRGFVRVQNGNYLDVRRENIIVLVKEANRGRPPKESRPTGCRASKNPKGFTSASGRPTSPLWTGGVTFARPRPGGGEKVGATVPTVGSGRHRRTIAGVDGSVRNPDDGAAV